MNGTTELVFAVLCLAVIVAVFCVLYGTHPRVPR